MFDQQNKSKSWCTAVTEYLNVKCLWYLNQRNRLLNKNENIFKKYVFNIYIYKSFNGSYENAIMCSME